LGKGIQLTRAPIVNFLADGTLTINGTLDNLRPEGTIKLERGQVNLFTTQIFGWARGYENTAKFFPNQGLDPTLDVRLRASVTEATQRRLPTDPLSAEIRDNPVTNLGSVRTVDIQARVDGPVSQLATNLELTSTPNRSKSEIVALLGGSFVDTLGRGDSTLGLANLAGSAFVRKCAKYNW
jgi:translocation and assembly module TamB